MKNIVFILYIILLGFSAHSQQLVWQTDIKKAIEISNKEKKPLLLFFTGSDWCGYCIRLQKEILKTEEFNDWAKDNVVLVELDFPRRKKQSEELQIQNSELLNAFKVSGFPVIFLANTESSEEKINFINLGRVNYISGGPKTWISKANEVLNFK